MVWVDLRHELLEEFSEYEGSMLQELAVWASRKHIDKTIYDRQRRRDPFKRSRNREEELHRTRERYHSDPEFRQKTLEASRRSKNRRYKTDEAYREKIKTYHKARYDVIKHDPAQMEKLRQQSLARYYKHREARVEYQRMYRERMKGTGYDTATITTRKV